MNALRSGVILPILAAVLSACTTVQTTQPGAVGVTRPQRMAVSAQEVEAASVQAYRKMLQEASAKGILNRDPAQLARVRQVVARLVPQTSAFRADALQWKWEANVFQQDQINAFAMSGGKIGIYSGLIDRLQLTDDELAAVIGHEMAHALREHVREQMSLQMAQQLPLVLIGAATGNQALVQLADAVAQVTLGLPRSRDAELEADRMGVELAARAGYDPRAAIRLWAKMRSAGGARGPEFLSTHPAPGNREEQLRIASQQVMPLYEAALRKR